MPIHVIVGASKNIGYTLAKHLDADKSNTVFGIARSIEAAQKQAAADGLRVTFFQGDLTNYDSLVAVAKTIGEKTGGVVDQLWNNGAYMSELTIDRFLSDFDQNEHQVLIDDLNKNWQTNVLGVINSTNAFLPLVRKSSIKKVATISTGLSDTQLARDYGIWENAPYAISKAALNMVVAKYDAKFRPEGVLFLAVCPGVVDNGREDFGTSEMGPKLAKYAPNMKVETPEESVPKIIKVVTESTAEKDGGAFYAHHGKGEKYL